MLRQSFIWDIPEEEFKQVVKESRSYNQVVKKYYSHAGNCRTIKARIKEDGIDISHFTGKSWAKGLNRPECATKSIPLDDILVENSNFLRGQPIKNKLIKAGVFEDKCTECGLGSTWNGKGIVLQLDHINGVHSDNRLENLRILCPNCHSQTINFCGKNQKDVEDKVHPKSKKDNKKRVCPDCNGVKSLAAIRCKKCADIHKAYNLRKVKDRPSKEILKKEVEETSYVSVGKKYGVSDNTIRKWIKF